jgi:hypothetical protein
MANSARLPGGGFRTASGSVQAGEPDEHLVQVRVTFAGGVLTAFVRQGGLQVARGGSRRAAIREKTGSCRKSASHSRIATVTVRG